MLSKINWIRKEFVNGSVARMLKIYIYSCCEWGVWVTLWCCMVLWKSDVETYCLNKANKWEMLMNEHLAGRIRHFRGQNKYRLSLYQDIHCLICLVLYNLLYGNKHHITPYQNRLFFFQLINNFFSHRPSFILMQFVQRNPAADLNCSNGYCVWTK